MASWLDKCARLRIELSGFDPWPETLRCVLEQDTLLSQCLSSPRCINGYRRLESHPAGGGGGWGEGGGSRNTLSRFMLQKLRLASDVCKLYVPTLGEMGGGRLIEGSPGLARVKTIENPHRSDQKMASAA